MKRIETVVQKRKNRNGSQGQPIFRKLISVPGKDLPEFNCPVVIYDSEAEKTNQDLKEGFLLLRDRFVKIIGTKNADVKAFLRQYFSKEDTIKIEEVFHDVQRKFDD